MITEAFLNANDFTTTPATEAATANDAAPANAGSAPVAAAGGAPTSMVTSPADTVSAASAVDTAGTADLTGTAGVEGAAGAAGATDMTDAEGAAGAAGMTGTTGAASTAGATGTMPSISLIAPCYNEERNVGPLVEAIVETFGAERVPCEIVLVNDGSADGTSAALASLAARESFDLPDEHAPFSLVTIDFSRNFGKESALFAGMEAATGDTLCFIDADLQQDPRVALDMYRYLVTHEECDIVAAYQAERSEGKATSWLKRKFYAFFNATSDEIELPADMSDFRVFTRQVANALLSLPERQRFTKGLFAWVGFNTHAVPYTVNERHDGTSSWSTRSLFKYAYSGITSFSTWPLKILKAAGSLVALLAMLYLLYVIVVDYLIFGIGIPGYPTLVCLILLFGGLQLLALGVVGDYLARSYVESKRRPLYITRDITRRTF